MSIKNVNVNAEYIPWYSDEYEVPGARNSRVNDYMSLTPQDIKKALEKNVVNQEEACRKVAVMMYQHIRGHRFVGLLAGPTGSGKSFIAENLKELFPDVVYIRDVSNVTKEGWIGGKKLASLFVGVHIPYPHSGKPQPVLFLDECDKLFEPKTNSANENTSEHVQGEFLSMIHGGEVMVAGPDDKGLRALNTSGISFLFMGAFEKTAKAAAEKESNVALGFGSNLDKLSSYHRELTIDDVNEAGCITELCGRIQRIVSLNKFGESDFRQMLDIKDRGPVYELEREFCIPIIISDEKKDELAHNAFKTGLGIRSIKNSIREYIDELTWNDCHAGELEIV